MDDQVLNALSHFIQATIAKSEKERQRNAVIAYHEQQITWYEKMLAKPAVSSPKKANLTPAMRGHYRYAIRQHELHIAFYDFKKEKANARQEVYRYQTELADLRQQLEQRETQIADLNAELERHATDRVIQRQQLEPSPCGVAGHRRCDWVVCDHVTGVENPEDSMNSRICFRCGAEESIDDDHYCLACQRESALRQQLEQAHVNYLVT